MIASHSSVENYSVLLTPPEWKTTFQATRENLRLVRDGVEMSQVHSRNISLSIKQEKGQ